MEATELRLGNWVKDFGDGYGKVTGIYPANPRYEEEADVLTTANPTPQPIYTFNPIPLTLAILESAGFSPEKMGDGFDNYRNGGVTISMPYFKFCFDDYDAGIEVAFLHQLQNLYFALTQTELNITL